MLNSCIIHSLYLRQDISVLRCIEEKSNIYKYLDHSKFQAASLIIILH